MGKTRTIIRAVASTALWGSAIGITTFALSTRNSKFIPFTPSDPLLSSAAYQRNNPNRNPGTNDICVRKVPLADLKADLVEGAPEGKLVEGFCAGVWSGLGYAYQRSYLEKKYRNDTTTKHQLWSTDELRDAKYDVGTEITDHFEVVSKTPEAIVVRCGASPLEKGIRDSDGLFEMGVVVNKEEQFAEFRLKSAFFKGTGNNGAPMPAHIEFLHRLYTKLWMETAIRNVMS